MIETRLIEDRDTWLKWREEDITASVGACLFGADVHPNTSAYQMWAFKSRLAKPTPIDRKLARRGQYVEMIAPALLKEERPLWHVEASREYYRDPEARIGATPDLLAQRPDIEGTGVIDVKSVGNRAFAKWKDRDTGDPELPIDMSIQVNIQAGMVAGATWGAVLAVTIGDQGLEAEVFGVPILPGLFANFRELARDFWRRVEEKDPYPIDWGKDAATVLDIYQDDDGSVVDLSDDLEFDNLVAQRTGYQVTEQDGAEAKKLRKKVDAQIIGRMGNARSARFRSGLLKAKTVKVKEAVRAAYSFRKLSVMPDEARAALPAEPLD